MLIDIKMNKIIFLIVSLLCMVSPSKASDSDVNQWLTKLDKSLEKSSVYQAQHEQHIQDLKKMITGHESLDARFEFTHRIFQAYLYYNADSAIVYAQKSMNIATKLNKPELIALAKCNLAFICVTSGDNIQAYQLISSIDVSDMPTWLKIEYYKTKNRLWTEQRYSFVACKKQQAIYARYAEDAVDSLLALVQPKSADWFQYTIAKKEAKEDNDQVIKLANQALANTKDKHFMAGLFMLQAWAYKKKGDNDKALVCFIKSAICDNESSTMELTSLYNLSNSIKHIDDARASRYMAKALDAINFFNAPVRFVALSNIMPQVEKTRLGMVSQQRDLFIILSVCVFVVLCVLGGAYFYSHKLNLRLKQAHALISQHLAELNSTNEQLVEANTVKNEYIARTLYDSTEYISALEHYFNIVNKALVTRQYDKIKNMTSQDLISNERSAMFKNFDKTFLALFPIFVEQYNSLFNESDRKNPSEEGTLTSEMRIFALIRMGISENERIAHYLGYSVHTVNTYKTRAKNRSFVNNDEFEKRILSF